MLETIHHWWVWAVGHRHSFAVWSVTSAGAGSITALFAQTPTTALIAIIPGTILALLGCASLGWRILGEPRRDQKIAQAMAERAAELEAQVMEERAARRRENQRHKQELATLNEKLEAMHMLHRNEEAKLKADIQASAMQAQVNSAKIDTIVQMSGEIPTKLIPEITDPPRGEI